MVPISSAVAAAYAASDRNFAEWFAPAGKKRGLLSGDKKYISVIGVRHDYGKTDRDLLDANQVNPVRVIAGNGIYLWGISTLQRETSARQFVSVRRLLLRIETLLQDRIMFNVFDPNDEILRNAIIALCDRELQAIKDGRGLYAFVVVCDDSNNTVEDVINGDLNINLYLDAVLPAKRIIVNLVINRTGVRSTVL
jgi:phage tail sheath protein FI